MSELKYSKGKWTPSAFGIFTDYGGKSQRMIIAISSAIDYVEGQNDLELAAACANECQKINPQNPQTVAESISFMYEALNRAYNTLDQLIEQKYSEEIMPELEARSTRHYIKDCLSQLKKDAE